VRIPDLDDRGLADQVDPLDRHRVHPGTEHLLQLGEQDHLVGDRRVQDQDLPPVAAEEPGMIAQEHDHEDQRHQRGGEPHRTAAAQRSDDPQRQRGEVVGHLVLVQLGRAQPDDRQHPEQPQAQAGPDGARAERAGHGQHADVHPQVRDHEIATAMAREVEPEDEHADRDQVDRVQNKPRHDGPLHQG
jgi:hypothetical protein